MCEGPKCRTVSIFFHLRSTLLGKLMSTSQNKQTENIALLLPNSRLRPREMQRPCKGCTGTPVCVLSAMASIPWGQHSKS